MKTTLTAVMLAFSVLGAAAGEIRINSLDVEADRAVSVTGPQSNQLARAAAAAGYAYSPTNPPPAAGNVASVNGQTGVVVITAESIGAVTNAPVPTLAQAAAAGGFAGTEEITPSGVRLTGETYSSFADPNGLLITENGTESARAFLRGDAGLGLYASDLSRSMEISPVGLVARAGGPPSMWDFCRPEGGEFTPAATSDITNAVAPKLDRSGGTATNLSVTGTFTVNGDNLASRANEWRRIPFGSVGSTLDIFARQTIRSTDASQTSLCGVSECGELCLYRLDVYNTSSTTNFSFIAQRANLAGTLIGPAQTNTIVVTSYASTVFALPAAPSVEHDFVRLRYEAAGSLSAFLYFRAFYERRATASETAAYAAGWRP